MSGRAPEDLFGGDGDVPAEFRKVDWSATALGPPQDWSPSLQAMVRVLLGSRFPMWIGWGPELSFLYNDAYRRDTLDTKHPWALGRPAREVWSEIWDEIGPRIETVLASGTATWDEALLLFLERSGFREETYHTFSYSPLTDNDGSIAGILCIVAEETERVIGERRMAALRQLADRLSQTRTESEVLAAAQHQFDETAHDVPFSLVYLFDADGAARRGCASGLPEGHRLAPCVLDPDASDAIWPAEVIRRGGLPVPAVTLAGPDLPGGPWAEPPHQAMVVPLAGQGEAEPAGFLVAAANPYRPLDVALRGFIELVANQIALALASARSHEAEQGRIEALAALDRAKTAFFQNVSHELRTPLTLMLGPLSDLHGLPGLDDDARAKVILARANTLRLRQLVNSLLDFARVEAGHMIGIYQPVDLAATTTRLAARFTSAVEQAGLALIVDCPPLPEPVYVDASMWEKVVLNLLSNALKFTFSGSITVTLRSDDRGAELHVTDTGEGIAAAELPRLFSRFHRVRATRARTHEGTGIGLALVDELIRLHGGTVAVDSELGRGTTMAVRVPFGRTHLPEREVASEALSPAETTGPDPLAEVAAPFLHAAVSWSTGAGDVPSSLTPAEARPRLLVVEDNADMRQYLRVLLEPHFVVETATNGAEALLAVASQLPDLVVTDVMMPEVDGLELVHRLRSDPRSAHVAVVMLSARAGEESAVEGLERGADNYLVKPFSGPELLARVRATLGSVRRRDEELRRQEVSSQRFFELSLDMLGVAGLDGYLKRVNPAYSRILGWSEEELLARPFRDFVHPEDRANLDAQVAELCGGRETLNYQTRIVHKDGSDRVILASGRPVVDEGVMYVVASDITDRQRTEAVVAMNAGVLDRVARGEPLPVVLDALTRAVEAQAPRTMASILLVDDDGVHLRHGAAPSLPDAYNRAIDGLVIGPTAGSCGTAAHRRAPVIVEDVQSDPLWADFRDLASTYALASCWSVPICSAEGEALGTFALYHSQPRGPDAADLQLIDSASHLARVAIEHDRAERRLGQSEQRFRTMATEVPVGIFQTDHAGVLVFANQRSCAIVGRPVQEVVGTSWADYVHPEDRDVTLASMADVLTERVDWAIEYRVVLPGNCVRDVAISARALHDADGRLTGFLGTLVDLTETKLAEERERQFAREHVIATTLQRSLLPQGLPSVDGVEVAVRYLAGGAGLEVGGDWYDVFALPGQRVGLAIGDVVGRGLGAAVVMGQLRVALRTLAEVIDSPATVVRRLSGLAEDLVGDQMTTLVYGVVDLVSRQFRYTCAGHPPPLLRPPTGMPMFLEGGRGLPLGVGLDEAAEAVVRLDAGTTLLLYTDGLVERRDASLDHGLARLRTAVAGPDHDLEALCDGIIESLGAEAAGDDVALVALRLSSVDGDERQAP